MVSGGVKGCEDYLLEGLRRRYISLSVSRGLCVLPDIGRGLCN
jgi:hypothetical protein